MRIYFIDGQIVTTDHLVPVIPHEHMIDTNYPVTEPIKRYGLWVPLSNNPDDFYRHKWQHVSIKDFSPEFRLQLLLLGVP